MSSRFFWVCPTYFGLSLSGSGGFLSAVSIIIVPITADHPPARTTTTMSQPGATSQHHPRVGMCVDVRRVRFGGHLPCRAAGGPTIATRICTQQQPRTPAELHNGAHIRTQKLLTRHRRSTATCRIGSSRRCDRHRRHGRGYADLDHPA